MPNGPKLKVGLVFDDSLDRDDGVAQYVRRLGDWLSQNGHEVQYLTGQTSMKDWRSVPVLSLSRNISVKFNGNRLTMPLWSNTRKIKKLLDTEQFDILHVMVPYSPLMAHKVILNSPAETVVVGTFHIFPSGFLSKFGSRLLRLWCSRSLRRFQEFAAVSQPAADFAKSSYHIDCSVIPNPVDLRQFSLKNKTSSRSENIVFLGRLVKRKGCEQLLKAFALIKDEFPDVRLIVAGTGQQAGSLKNKSEQLGLGSRVEFRGYIPEEDKPKLLSSASIACFPSLYGEAFGIVLIEAMAAGAQTVLGGDNPGYRSVLSERPELLFDPNDTREFAAKLRTYLKDPSKRRTIGDWQSQTVKQYDVAIVGNKIVDLYERAIAKTPKNRHND
ncbi:glycosyltransferase family 4 protein [Candidatus Saccharibacteria bacterium]|nr:glycosyltransferase family 4 protein [Candidatus Saccharibacteria bacterium]